MTNDDGQGEFWKGRGAVLLLAIPAVPALILAFHVSTLLGIAVVIGLAAIGLHVWKSGDKRRLLVSDDALVVHGSSGMKQISWKDAYYTCDAVPDEDDAFTLGEHFIDGVVITAFRLIFRAIVQVVWRRPRKYRATIRLHGPADTTISVGDYSAASDAEARILAAIHSVSIDTSPFVLEADGLSHDGKVLPFGGVARVIVNDSFTVGGFGTLEPWASVPINIVHNPWSLIELLLKRGTTCDHRFIRAARQGPGFLGSRLWKVQ